MDYLKWQHINEQLGLNYSSSPCYPLSLSMCNTLFVSSCWCWYVKLAAFCKTVYLIFSVTSRSLVLSWITKTESWPVHIYEYEILSNFFFCKNKSSATNHKKEYCIEGFKLIWKWIEKMKNVSPSPTFLRERQLGSKKQQLLDKFRDDGHGKHPKRFPKMGRLRELNPGPLPP